MDWTLASNILGSDGWCAHLRSLTYRRHIYTHFHNHHMLFFIWLLLLSILLPSHFTLPLCTYLVLLHIDLVLVVYSFILVYFIHLVLLLCCIFPNLFFLTLHRWEGLVSKHLSVKSTPVVFCECHKYNLIWTHNLLFHGITIFLLCNHVCVNDWIHLYCYTLHFEVNLNTFC